MLENNRIITTILGGGGGMIEPCSSSHKRDQIMLLSYKIFGHMSCKLKDYIGTHKKKKKKEKKKKNCISVCVFIL